LQLILSHKPNFSGYTYKEDMISDGIENCLLYIDNFDPEKSNNPFAYFTQIIYYAFLRRIAKEKKVLYTKLKYTEESITAFNNESTQHKMVIILIILHQVKLVNGQTNM
jgi:DNA-directed RNA polymerase specialized sigma subunit